MRATIVLAISCLVGCANKPLDPNGGPGGAPGAPSTAGSGAAATGGSGAPPSSGGASVAVKEQSKDMTPEAGAPASEGGTADPGQPISCTSLAAGGSPDRLEDLQWEYQVGSLDDSNRPYDVVTIDQGCALTYRRTNPPLDAPPVMRTLTTRTVTMTAADCTAARAWATNGRFLSVLDTGDGCPYGPGNPDDLFMVNLTDGTLHQRKTYLCPQPTLDAVRACLSGLVERLLP